MDHVRGDKVVWIIVLLLMLFSIVLIFSSSSRLTNETTDRLDIVKDQLMVVGLGLVFLLCTYFFLGLEFLRKFSWLGLVVSFVLLLILDIKGIGPIKVPVINGAVRFLEIGGKQLHVFEVVKVAMVMYIAWAVDKLKNGEFKLLDKLSEQKRLGWLRTGFARKCILLYLPSVLVFLMVMKGSNTAALLIGALLVLTMEVGAGSLKEFGIILLAGAVMLAGIYGIYSISKARGDEDVAFKRIGTAVSRLTPHNYEKEYKLAKTQHEKQLILDDMYQPYSAKIAIHQGAGLGKGPGQSTQRYVVPDMPEDYMFSFILEEYGLLGGLVALVLYVSLMARGVLIVKNCGNNIFAQCAVFGLVMLISGQAFLHMLVNCDLGPLTGQTLPMLSHGASAFICFSIAFGIILSISRASSKKVEQLTRKAEPLVDLVTELEDQLNQTQQYDEI